MGDVIGDMASVASATRRQRAVDAVHALWRATLDLALPRLCAVCRAPVEGEGLCPACWSKLSFITRPYCERLGVPFVYDPGPGILSMQAIADPPAYKRARRGALRRDLLRAGARAQIRRPARSDADDGAMARPGRPRASGRCGRARSRAVALAAAMGAPLQPVCGGGSRRI